MRSILPPLHMYADSVIDFRDPFVSRDADDDSLNRSWYSYSQYSDFNRALTPPPEMSGLTHSSKSGYFQQERGPYYGDYFPSQQTYRATGAPYMPQEVSNADFGRNGVATQPNSRTISPVLQPRQLTVDDTLKHHAQQKRESQANAIAPSFQIPKSVNDSGGSLSELAAQVCSNPTLACGKL